MRAQPAIARRSGVIVAVAGALITSACAAGQAAQTAYERPTLDGTQASVGKIELRGIAIAAPTGTPTYRAGDSATLRVVIINTGRSADQLVSVTSPAASSWKWAATQGVASSAASPVKIPPGTRVGFGTPESQNVLTLLRLKQNEYPGTTVPLTFTFANAGAVTVPVPVEISTTPPASTVYAPTIPPGSPVGE